MTFSIIAPTFNQIEFIQDNINSVLSQDFNDFEYILLDDCSTQSYNSIVNKYKNNPKFKYIRNNTNFGRVKNYQNAIRIAQGEYVILCDGDDYFVDNKMLSKLYSIISNLSPNLILSGMYVGNTLDNSICLTSKFENKITKIDNDKYFFKNIDKVVFSHFGCVYKRSLALENNFYSLNILSSDMASIFGIIKHGKIIVLKESFGFWRKHPFQESKKDKFSKSYIFNYLICWTYILNLNKNCTEEIGLIINNKYINTLNKINQHSSKYVKLYLYFLLVLKYPKYTLNYIYYRFGFL